MDRSEANSGTREVLETSRFDQDSLARWMKEHVEGFTGPLAVDQFKGGQSNPTYRLLTPSKAYVLRRQPPGKLLPGAHAIDREYRVLTALAQANFPVPRTYHMCEDSEVLGTPFYVMDMVEGRIFWEAHLPQVATADRAAYFDAMNATIAALHVIDPAAIGLGDYGKPGDYFARQIGRWSRQYLGDEAAGRVSAMDRLVEWLPANAPASQGETRIIHGDFRCDNMIFHPAEPRVLAVLDWELSTLGDPLSDFAYHLMMYRMPAGITAGLLGRDLSGEGIPSEDDYVAAYCRRTGRDGIANLDFLIAFNMFRLAAILHGIKARVARGTAASAHAANMTGQLDQLAELAWAQAVRAGA